ncbi:MAG: hypothetical protein D6719_04940, partial [Candidatus Dadabacteria bacterium]
MTFYHQDQPVFRGLDEEGLKLPDSVRRDQPFKLQEEIRGRYYRMVENLAGDQGFVDLARGIMPRPDDIGESWHSYRSYSKVIGALLAALPLDPDIVRGNPDYRHNLISYSRDLESIGARIKEKQPAVGITAAEIGGHTAAKIVEALGGSCSFVDAGTAHMDLELTREGAFDARYVTLNNWDQFFDRQFDLTVSNRLIDTKYRSGPVLVDMTRDGRISSDYLRNVALETLAVFYNLTREGGYSIHGGAIISAPVVFSWLGMRPVLRAFEGPYIQHQDLIVFRRERSTG